MSDPPQTKTDGNAEIWGGFLASTSPAFVIALGSDRRKIGTMIIDDPLDRTTDSFSYVLSALPENGAASLACWVRGTLTPATS